MERILQYLRPVQDYMTTVMVICFLPPLAMVALGIGFTYLLAWIYDPAVTTLGIGNQSTDDTAIHEPARATTAKANRASNILVFLLWAWYFGSFLFVPAILAPFYAKNRPWPWSWQYVITGFGVSSLVILVGADANKRGAYRSSGSLEVEVNRARVMARDENRKAAITLAGFPLTCVLTRLALRLSILEKPVGSVVNWVSETAAHDYRLLGFGDLGLLFSVIGLVLSGIFFNDLISERQG